MTVRHMRDDIVLHLADRYEVNVKWVDAFEIPKNLGGPQGHGCDPSQRVVFFDKDPDPLLSEGLETYLHELAHVIVQPPWWTITDTPEEFVLFQFERSLANAFLDEENYTQVLGWQEETALSIMGDEKNSVCLCDLPQYKRMPFWRKGFALCRTLGLLDKRNRPTLQNPDWSRLEGQQDSLARYYRLPWTRSLEGSPEAP